MENDVFFSFHLELKMENRKKLREIWEMEMEKGWKSGKLQWKQMQTGKNPENSKQWKEPKFKNPENWKKKWNSRKWKQ